jgi:hypothetical protein
MRSKVVPGALAGVLSAVVVLGAACGDDSGSGSPSVEIAVDRSAAGDPNLVGGPSADDQQQRVAITPDGVPTALYAVRLRELSESDSIRALSTVTVTKCQHTDYDPKQRSYTGCEFTQRYGYNPVDVETRFRLVADASGKPDLGGDGMDVGDANRTTCTSLKHHCTVINLGEAELGSSVGEDNLEWLVLEMTATNPKASSCTPPAHERCEVLAVEVQKGTAMYAVDVRGDPAQPAHLPSDRERNGDTVPVIDDETLGNSRQAGRQVVYSIPLAAKGKEHELLGDQFEVGALLRVQGKTGRLAPLVTSYIVLSDEPDGVRGRYLVSDSYSPDRTGNTGENCSGTCAYVRGAAATVILPCDVRAKRRFVNLVAGAARDAAPPGEHVRVLDGGMRIVRYYDNEVSANSGGSC